MFFLRKFLYGICLYRTQNRFENAKNKSLDTFMQKDILGVGRFILWWNKTMPLFMGGVDDCRSRSKWRKLELGIRQYGTFENFIVKSFAGFTFGVILTYGLYFLFVFPLNFSFAGATLWCVIIGFISTLGLAFSEYFRSIALLSLPSFFSGKGRQALTTYAIILAVTGPGKNSLNNVRALSDSIGCSQERVRKSLKDVFYLTKNPYVAIKQSLSVVIARLMEVAKKMKAITDSIKKQVLAVDEVFIMASKNLNQVGALCQSKGRPYDTCIKALKAAADDCKVSPNCLFGGIYQSDDLPRSICNYLRAAESICALPPDTSDQISKKVQKKLSNFARRLYNLLAFKLTKSHESHYELFKSRQVKDVVNAIATDLRELTGSILYLFDSVSVLFSFFYIYLFYSVITFRNKYLAHEWYENRYITSNLLLIEMKRIRQNKTTIFPLSRIERQKYIKINSLNLGTMDVYEMYNMIIKAVALLIKLSLHMAADYGLWWLIMQCRRAANHVQVPEGMSDIEVLTYKAGGISGEIYDEIANAFQPTRFNFTTDMTSCLPEPSAPDWQRNITIMLIGILTVLIGFMEPYGKRLKISIMNFYYPIIARRRAVWLYNHIHRTRNSFTRVARRRLRRQYGRWDRMEPEAATFIHRFRCTLAKQLPIATLRKIVTPKEKYNRCILCKAFGAPDDPLTSCVTPGCKGTYCLECFANLQNLCTICLKPIDYNDVSDMSEERDSSDEEKQLRTGTPCKTPLGIVIISSDSEASTADSDDFDLMLDGIRSTMNDERCDLDDIPYAPQSVAGRYSKVKDWATMQDFDLPKGEQAQYAIAEQGMAMTLSFRIRTGFSGLLFPKPIFGKAAELENIGDTFSAGHSRNQDLRDNIVRSPMPLDLSKVPQKVLKYVQRALSQKIVEPTRVRPFLGTRDPLNILFELKTPKMFFKKFTSPDRIGKLNSPQLNFKGFLNTEKIVQKCREQYELCRTSPTGYYSGSGYGSRSHPGHFSGMSTKLSNGQEDNFKILERGCNKRKHLLEVYRGLQMSESEYQRVGSRSGSEVYEQSDDSSDGTEVKTAISVSLSADKHSQDESTRPGCTVTSQHCESSPSFSRYSVISLKRGTATTCTSDQESEPSDGDQLQAHFRAAPARPSFRNIKVLPNKSQVTHQMFHVDEFD